MTPLDRLADRLAEHGDLHRAAVELRVSLTYVEGLFRQMRKRLGWQAR